MKASLLFTCLFFARAAFALLPSDFNEPNIVLYGKVTDTGTPAMLQSYNGTLTYTITPSNGTAFSVTGALERLDNGNYSYRVDVPVQKLLGTTTYRLDSNTVGSTVSNLTVGVTATVNGVAASLFAANGSPFPTSFTFNETLRGNFQRIDLNYVGDGSGFDVDTDGDGMPDWWEILHGLNPNDPDDALLDPDGDGVPNLLEYYNGTDPQCYEYTKWLADHGLSAAMAAPDADPDGDGIPNILEYAVGTDPRTADRTLFDSKVIAARETIAGNDYLTLTVHHPGTRQCNADYIVETSSDLSTWNSTEGTNVVTLTNAAGQFKIRDASFVGQAGVNRHFIRLRIVQKP